MKKLSNASILVIFLIVLAAIYWLYQQKYVAPEAGGNDPNSPDVPYDFIALGPAQLKQQINPTNPNTGLNTKFKVYSVNTKSNTLSFAK